MNDLELWKRLKHDDKVAFEELYHRYYSPLFNYALRLRFDDEIIKDTLQEIFIRIYIKRFDLPEISSVKSYLYRCLINSLLNTKKSPQNNIVSLEELVDFSIDDAGFEILFERSDTDLKRVRLLKKGLKQLSSKQKNILYLRFIQEFSWEELAQVFDMSSHSCMNLLGRTVAKLRSIIDIA